MDETTDDSGGSVQMKCPCCGENISLAASKGLTGNDGSDGDQEWESNFRESMSPRNDEQPT